MPKGKKPTTAIDAHVGARVRMRRIQLGLSQEKLAEPLGLTFQQVQKYENGKNRIGAGRLVQIAHVLQVYPPYFFEGLEVPADGGGGAGGKILDDKFGVLDPLKELLAHRDGLALATAFNSLTGHEPRAVIVRMAEMLAAKEARS